MGEKRILTDEELERGLQTWRPEDHRPTTLAYACALALHSAKVARDKLAEIEAAEDDEAVFGDHNLIPSLRTEIEQLKEKLELQKKITDEEADERIRAQREEARAKLDLDEMEDELAAAKTSLAAAKAACEIVKLQREQYEEAWHEIKGKLAKFEREHEGDLLSRENTIKDLQEKLKKQSGDHSCAMHERNDRVDELMDEVSELTCALSGADKVVDSAMDDLKKVRAERDELREWKKDHYECVTQEAELRVAAQRKVASLERELLEALREASELDKQVEALTTCSCGEPLCTPKCKVCDNDE